MKKLVLLFCSVCCGQLMSNKAVAQDIHFSQFYENAILRNPALTGIFSGDYKVGVNYRTQWSSISVPFQTVLASAETRKVINREVGDYLSFGVSATYDKAGTINFNSFQIYPAINYNKALEDNYHSYISVGFTGGYIQRSIDLTKATFSSQYSGGSYSSANASGENITNTVMSNFDLGAGISYNSSAGANRNVNYYIGAAAYHITKPKQAFDPTNELIRLNTKMTGNLGVKWDLTNEYAVTTHMNYTRQGTYRETIMGGLVSWRNIHDQSSNFVFHAGTYLRFKDAIIPTVKVEYKNYAFVMSYDVNTSSLRPASNGLGGFEMSLYLRGDFTKSRQMGYQTECPRFERMLDGSGTNAW